MDGMIAVYIVAAVLLAAVFLAVWGLDRSRSRRQAQDPERTEPTPDPQDNPRADSWSDPHQDPEDRA